MASRNRIRTIIPSTTFLGLFLANIIFLPSSKHSSIRSLENKMYSLNNSILGKRNYYYYFFFLVYMCHYSLLIR